MKVFEGLESVPSRLGPSAVTIGNYDGVHRGHQAVIGRLRSRAGAIGGAPTVVTFDPHPQSFLHGEAPPALATWEDKIDLLKAQKIERVCVLKFDAALAAMEPETFIEEILVARLKTSCVVVGGNFRFGRFARGDSTMLRRYGKQNGFTFESVRLSRLAGRTVSSTEIRHAIAEGDLVWANLALGRQFRLRGEVVRGEGRGRQLGFPTANIEVPSGMCLPMVGIYGGWLTTDSETHLAAISVGTNPTFGENPVTIEAYLPGVEMDLYGKPVAVHFESFIREERRFASAETLIEAIDQDVRQIEVDSARWEPPR